MTDFLTSTDLTNLAIVFLAALLHATVQLGLAALTLLYHESATRFVTRRTKNLISSFISGTGVMIILFLGATCFVADRLLGLPLTSEILCIIAGILVATSIVMFFLYYRSSGTELYIPKSAARFITRRAAATTSNTESFSLGVLCSFGELPLIITPLIVASSSILSSSPDIQLPLVGLYTLVAILPSLVFRFSVHTGRTAIDIQKWRVKNKNFLRATSSVAFLALAAFIIVFKVLS